MARLWRNPEFRAHTKRLALLFFLLAAMMVVLAAVLTKALQAAVVDQASALIGKVAAARPEVLPDVVGAVVVPAEAGDVALGRQVLLSYGYGTDAPASSDPILVGKLPWLYLAAVAVPLLAVAASLAMAAGGYSKIYRKARRIAEAAEKAVDGDFSVVLPAGEEGDFEILGHRFNQMANRLKLNLEQLMAEKVFLKNTISDISHQLKTPLSTLVVYNDLMSENEMMDPAQRREFLALGRLQLQRLEWLIQSLLKMARLEAGSIQFRKEPVPLRGVVDEAVSALSAMAADAGVAVAVRELHPDASMIGDGPWLAEAVINILKNAIEHSRAGSSVTIELDQTALTASLAVRDRGEGIDAQDIPHVFERFYRSTSTVKPNSVGIGLAMAKAIVEGQGGSLTVKSRRGEGSLFEMMFLKTLQ